MYTLHPEMMPEGLQSNLLADIDPIVNQVNSRLPLLPSQEAAITWLDTTVTRLTAHKSSFTHMDAWRYPKNDQGGTLNTEVHRDGPLGHGDRIKFVVVVSSHPRGGTLFFNDQRDMRGKQSYELFTRKKDQLSLRPDLQEETEWEQAEVGQLCSFTPETQMHAAAPFFLGDHKILMYALSKYLPR